MYSNIFSYIYRWQQVADKTKEKLKEKCTEYDKLQQNYENAKTTITRLEREKCMMMKSQKGTIISLFL